MKNHEMAMNTYKDIREKLTKKWEGQWTGSLMKLKSCWSRRGTRISVCKYWSHTE